VKKKIIETKANIMNFTFICSFQSLLLFTKENMKSRCNSEAAKESRNHNINQILQFRASTKSIKELLFSIKNHERRFKYPSINLQQETPDLENNM
jgi:hypothetical protein